MLDHSLFFNIYKFFTFWRLIFCHHYVRDTHVYVYLERLCWQGMKEVKCSFSFCRKGILFCCFFHQNVQNSPHFFNVKLKIHYLIVIWQHVWWYVTFLTPQVLLRSCSWVAMPSWTFTGMFQQQWLPGFVFTKIKLICYGIRCRPHAILKRFPLEVCKMDEQDARIKIRAIQVPKSSRIFQKPTGCVCLDISSGLPRGSHLVEEGGGGQPVRAEWWPASV